MGSHGVHREMTRVSEGAGSFSLSFFAVLES